MALNITTLTQRWGELYQGISESDTFAATTVESRANDIYGQYASFAAQREVVDDLYENALNVRNDLGDWSAYLYGVVGTTLQTMCRDDSARPKTDDLIGWFDKLNRDMSSQTTYFTRPTFSAAVAVPGTNIGDGYVIAGANEPVDGIACYFGYSEVIRVDCTVDSYSGGATAGSETFQVSGETQIDYRHTDWPKGSGASFQLTPVTLASDEIVTDGGLEAWTLVSGANYTADNWTLLSGTVTGTHHNRNASVVYSGTYSAIMTGDGATTDTGFYQVLSQTVVKGNTSYAISFWYRTDSASFTAGTLQIALTDGTETVITDNAGNNVSTTVSNADLGAANGTWTRKTATFITPRNLPTELRLEFRFTTIVDTGESVYFDHIIMSEQTQAYPGGPYLAIHAGDTAFAFDDQFTVTCANNKTNDTFVRVLDRTFNLAENGIRLETYGGSGTEVADSLLTP